MNIFVARVAALLAALLLIPAAALADPTFPTRRTEPVVDAAHILAPNQIQALNAKLAAFEQSTKQQLVVATIPDLQGYDIADYGYRLGRAWGIGEKGANNGVILVIAPNQRRMTIQVGYGLEGALTDALSNQIIRSDITPRFKAGDMPGGINAGVDDIMRVIQLPPDQQQKLNAQAAQRPHASPATVVKAIGIVFFILFFVFISAIRAASRGGTRYRGGGGISPITVWAGAQILDDVLSSGRRGGGWGGGDGGGGFGGGGGWGGGDGGGFSGGGGSFGGGGASGGW